MSAHDLINPPELGPARGYSNGVLAASGRLLFVAGQIAWDADQQLVSDRFSEQFGQALSNVMTVVRAAGGEAEHVTRLRVFVTDKDAYVAQLKDVGAVYREHMGRHFPAMALVQVSALVVPGAQVEIEADAVIPE